MHKPEDQQFAKIWGHARLARLLCIRRKPLAGEDEAEYRKKHPKDAILLDLCDSILAFGERTAPAGVYRAREYLWIFSEVDRLIRSGGATSVKGACTTIRNAEERKRPEERNLSSSSGQRVDVLSRYNRAKKNPIVGPLALLAEYAREIGDDPLEELTDTNLLERSDNAWAWDFLAADKKPGGN